MSKEGIPPRLSLSVETQKPPQLSFTFCLFKLFFFPLTEPQLIQSFIVWVCPTFMWNVCDLHGPAELYAGRTTTQRCYMLWNVSLIDLTRDQSDFKHIAIRTNRCYGIPHYDLLNIIFFTLFCSIYLSVLGFCFFLIKKIEKNWVRVLWLRCCHCYDFLFSLTVCAAGLWGEYEE